LESDDFSESEEFPESSSEEFPESFYYFWSWHFFNHFS